MIAVVVLMQSRPASFISIGSSNDPREGLMSLVENGTEAGSLPLVWDGNIDDGISFGVGKGGSGGG